jgi:hypothetical protein
MHDASTPPTLDVFSSDFLCVFRYLIRRQAFIGMEPGSGSIGSSSSSSPSTEAVVQDVAKSLAPLPTTTELFTAEPDGSIRCRILPGLTASVDLTPTSFSMASAFSLSTDIRDRLAVHLDAWKDRPACTRTTHDPIVFVVDHTAPLRAKPKLDLIDLKGCGCIIFQTSVIFSASDMATFFHTASFPAPASVGGSGTATEAASSTSSTT